MGTTPTLNRPPHGTTAPKYSWPVILSRRTATVARWLHIYLSMASFGILFVFAITGLTLNHVEWFANQQRTVQAKGTLNNEWLQAPTVQKLEIVEQIRKTHGVKAPLGYFRIELQLRRIGKRFSRSWNYVRLSKMRFRPATKGSANGPAGHQSLHGRWPSRSGLRGVASECPS